MPAAFTSSRWRTSSLWLATFAAWASTAAFVSASTQSNRRSTVNGKITFRYSFLLYGPRSRLQIFQMKSASSACVRSRKPPKRRATTVGSDTGQHGDDWAGIGQQCQVEHGDTKLTRLAHAVDGQGRVAKSRGKSVSDGSRWWCAVASLASGRFNQVQTLVDVL